MRAAHVVLTGLVLALLLPAAGCSAGLGAVSRIVLVTFDTTRADRLGCYGYAAADTPNLDRFAAASVLFEQAVSPIPTTLPSHATMFTGRYPFAHGVRYNILFRLGREAYTLAEALQSAGYATQGLPAALVLARRYGLDQGFDRYREPPRPAVSGVGALARELFSEVRSASEGVDLALEWLAGQRGRKSFAWVHFYEPHNPYTPPFPYSSRFRERPYDGEIAYTDEHFGRLMDALRADADWPSTLVIVAGDHGEGLHEHGERFHANLVYETTQRVPLIIGAPGARPARVAEPVSLVDLMPTVLDLAGLDVPAGLQGVSLRPALQGRRLPQRDLYFESLSGSLTYGWAELRGLRRGAWKLIDSTDPELYDLAGDPDELTNLAPLEPQRLEELRGALTRLAESAPEEPVHAEEAVDPILDEVTEQFLASLGYVGRASGGGSSPENAPHPRTLIDMDGELVAAQVAVARREWHEVERLSRYVLERDATNKWALHNIAYALLHLKRAADAEEYGLEMVRLYPDLERSYSILARAYEARGDSEKAYAVLRRGREAIPESQQLTYLGLVAAFDAGVEEVCSEEVPGAVNRYPLSPKMMVLQARCLAREGDTAGALEWLAASVEQGFTELKLLERAEDFRAVTGLPGFGALLDVVSAAEPAGPGAADLPR